MAGSRESRRLAGDYVLTENDILANRVFEDGVAYGGWPMDEHTAGGFWAKGEIPSKVRSFPGFYSIPYGCYCSKNIENLMMAGRDISATKLAMGSTRVMGICAVGGEAAGVAAARAAMLGMTPREYGKSHMEELRQELLKNDCYVMGCRNKDERDLALNDWNIPMLAAQTFVENSIKYAKVGGGDSALLIEIQTNLLETENGRYLNLIVKDNGQGYGKEILDEINGQTETGKKNIGINNLKRRCQILYGGKVEFTFYNSNGAVSEMIFPEVTGKAGEKGE